MSPQSQAPKIGPTAHPPAPAVSFASARLAARVRLVAWSDNPVLQLQKEHVHNERRPGKGGESRAPWLGPQLARGRSSRSAPPPRLATRAFGFGAGAGAGLGRARPCSSACFCMGACSGCVAGCTAAPLPVGSRGGGAEAEGKSRSPSRPAAPCTTPPAPSSRQPSWGLGGFLNLWPGPCADFCLCSVTARCGRGRSSRPCPCRRGRSGGPYPCRECWRAAAQEKEEGVLKKHSTRHNTSVPPISHGILRAEPAPPCTRRHPVRRPARRLPHPPHPPSPVPRRRFAKGAAGFATSDPAAPARALTSGIRMCAAVHVKLAAPCRDRALRGGLADAHTRAAGMSRSCQRLRAAAKRRVQKPQV